MADGLKRAEAKQTGVYILIGTSETGDLAYIGESEDMAQRLRQHALSKDWWDQAVLITTAGDALHKAHVKYLESRLVELAKAAAQMPLENGNVPPRSSLNEAAIANMESFLDTLQMVLPAIRVDVFQSGLRTPVALPDDKSADATPIFLLSMPKRGVEAKARMLGGKFVMLAGSQIRSEWVAMGRTHESYANLYESLTDSGVIKQDADSAYISSDYAFSSPSAAASVATGRTANGRTEWKLSDGRTYADWEADQVKAQDL